MKTTLSDDFWVEIKEACIQVYMLWRGQPPRLNINYIDYIQEVFL